ncbi:MAG: GTPase Era [Acidobacteria bacterium]|nr:GTPase Era [Acidobacteriota bacterium]
MAKPNRKFRSPKPGRKSESGGAPFGKAEKPMKQRPLSREERLAITGNAAPPTQVGDKAKVIDKAVAPAIAPPVATPAATEVAAVDGPVLLGMAPVAPTGAPSRKGSKPRRKYVPRVAAPPRPAAATDEPKPRRAGPRKVGFIAIAGLPNAGKSTLLNALVGEKVAIVADKPQTTRTSVQGVLTNEQGQAIFIDTPGIHRSDSYFNRRMMSTVREALDAPDVRVYVADYSHEPTNLEWEAMDTLRRAHMAAPRPAILALNKIDLVDDPHVLLARLQKYYEHITPGEFEFNDYIPISATQGNGLDDLLETIFKYLPAGKPIFPADQFTDQPERYLAAEMIREQILQIAYDEVPHSVAVKVEEWEDKKTLTRIRAIITVEREGQKGIVIGAQGAALKQIGSAARAEIESFLGHKVLLQLFVAVKPRWRESETFVNELDWHSGPK